MNPESQEVLKNILKKELHELTEHDKGFLKARWSYVGKTSREKFKSILDEKPGKTKKEDKAPITPEVPFDQKDEEEETDTLEEAEDEE